jgi:hypothetical protein
MTMTDTPSMDRFGPITLAELDAQAALLTRMERKYVVSSAQLEAVLDNLAADVQVLEIDGRRTFDYESTYFDTPSYASYLGAARRRPDRFKVRTRLYVDEASSWLEVKLRNRTCQTIKHRTPHRASRGELATSGRAFLAGFDRLRSVVDQLVPMLTTSYRRSMIAAGSSRVSIDRAVRLADPSGRSIGLADWVVVECKSARAAGAVDRALWAVHARPIAISKYGVGMAALHPDLPGNKWRRAVARHVTTITP